ncbi:MAG TPA: hypothetical protein VF069_13010, partial [Streptosporangiaceae bacterium]
MGDGEVDVVALTVGVGVGFGEVGGGFTGGVWHRTQKTLCLALPSTGGTAGAGGAAAPVPAKAADAATVAPSTAVVRQME